MNLKCGCENGNHCYCERDEYANDSNSAFDMALSAIMRVFEEHGSSNEEIICNLNGLKDEIEILIDSLRK